MCIRDSRWNDNTQNAFINLKSAITSSLPLAFFDLDVQTEAILTTDASSCGIGGVLTQVKNGIEKPVYFVSRPAEKKFSSSELETLAVLWCVER